MEHERTDLNALATVVSRQSLVVSRQSLVVNQVVKEPDTNPDNTGTSPGSAIDHLLLIADHRPGTLEPWNIGTMEPWNPASPRVGIACPYYCKLTL